MTFWRVKMKAVDAPNWLLDYFRLHNGIVCWATKAELIAEPPQHRRRTMPFGQVAGGRFVIGYGRLVTCSGRPLLTADIKAAILDDYRWPWEAEPPYVVPGVAGPDDAAHIEQIHKLWGFENGELVWLVDAHSTVPQFTVAGGTGLVGRKGSIVTRYGTAYLRSDIEYVLIHGRFPWQDAPFAWD